MVKFQLPLNLNQNWYNIKIKKLWPHGHHNIIKWCNGCKAFTTLKLWRLENKLLSSSFFKLKILKFQFDFWTNKNYKHVIDYNLTYFDYFIFFLPYSILIHTCLWFRLGEFEQWKEGLFNFCCHSTMPLVKTIVHKNFTNNSQDLTSSRPNNKVEVIN
jgi:hypothetical protein